jgi:hypothetical protein
MNSADYCFTAIFLISTYKSNKMILFNFLLSIFLNTSSKSPEPIWYGKTFLYEVYCKKRSDFYTIELKGPKFYSIENVYLPQNNALQQTDNIIKNKYQSIVHNKKGESYYFDTRWGKCKLNKIPQTDHLIQKRLTLFYNALETQIMIQAGIDKIPKYEIVTDDFYEYDKTGNFEKVVQKYLAK